MTQIQVAYETYGTLNEQGSNAILACHALSMDAHPSNNNDPHVEPGWWNFMVGPNKAIDTLKFFVVCFNVLGGCYGSTGPDSSKPDSERKYLTDFPEVTIEDMVDIQKLALEQLGVKKLHTVIGGSLGGMQALEWSVRHPQLVERTIAIATGASLSPQGLAFDIVGRQCILNDPNWKNGQYQTEDVKNINGLALARMIGHITYISKQAMDVKFGRKLQDGLSDKGFTTAFAVESFLKYNSERFLKRFDPNTYLYLTKCMDTYDMVDGYSNLEESVERTQSKFLIISFSSDWLFPPANSVDLAKALYHKHKEATYVCIETDLGHDAFLIDAPELEAMKQLVRAFIQ